VTHRGEARCRPVDRRAVAPALYLRARPDDISHITGTRGERKTNPTYGVKEDKMSTDSRKKGEGAMPRDAAHPKDAAHPRDEAMPRAIEADTEGHDMGLMHPVAWELGKAKQQEVARESQRHSLIAAAKAKARRKS
jgi:hypothetical protein